MFGLKSSLAGRDFQRRSHAAMLCTLGAVLGCSSMAPQDDTAFSVLGAESSGGSAGNGGSAGRGGSTGNSGSAGSGAMLPKQWACLDTPTVFEKITPPPERILYSVVIVDFDSQPTSPTAIKDLEIVVCGSPSCDPPASAPDVVVKLARDLWDKSSGKPEPPPFAYLIDFKYGFANASLRLTAPDYAPMDYVFGGPMIGTPGGSPIVTGLSIPPLKESARDTIYKEVGLKLPVDPERGVIAVRTLNCLGGRAAGVKVESHPDSPPFPAVAWKLSNENHATANRLETDSRGVAGILNVEPRVYDLDGVAPVGEGGQVYGPLSLAARPGVITLAEIRDGIGVWGQ